jgi:pimeloyl-ACP methyl ester carboxylesterase
VPGVKHRDVAVNGVRRHIAEAGAGPPLILLHGWPHTGGAGVDSCRAWPKTSRVLAPHLRGWGWSDAPREDKAKATFAADILALMDAERLDRVSLLAHDWGGYTFFLVSLEHPERIERMIALDVTPPRLGRLQARHLAAPLLGSYQALLATPVLGPATDDVRQRIHTPLHPVWERPGDALERRRARRIRRRAARAATCEGELGVLPQLPHP